MKATSDMEYFKDVNFLYVKAQLADRFRGILDTFREDKQESSLKVDVKVAITGVRHYKNEENQLVKHTKTSEIQMSVKGALPLFFKEIEACSKSLPQIEDGSLFAV